MPQHETFRLSLVIFAYLLPFALFYLFGSIVVISMNDDEDADTNEECVEDDASEEYTDIPNVPSSAMLLLKKALFVSAVFLVIGAVVYSTYVGIGLIN